MIKIAKNHQILTSQNWCPFGPRTFPSCFRDRLWFAGAEPVKSGQNCTSKNAWEIWFSMVKTAKNHQILTSQNWCPFGHRTFSSCFRAWLRKSIANSQKWSTFYFSKNACEIRFSMLKVAKNHKNLTSQNWCPFGHRTFSSCFRAILRKSIAKTAKNDQHFTSQKMH